MVRTYPFLGSLALVALLLGGLSSAASAATKTWTGAIDNLWSTAGNWVGGVPVAGDRIAFPVSATNTTNTNDLTAGTVFFDITFLGSGYIINGNTIGLSDGIPANNGFNNRINADLVLTAPQGLSGSFCCAGLTLAGNVAYGANAITIERATVSGLISGTGALTTGDVTVFTANNTYTGSTTVTGRWEVNGSQPSSSVTVGPSSMRGSPAPERWERSPRSAPRARCRPASASAARRGFSPPAATSTSATARCSTSSSTERSPARATTRWG
jgi:hypothetical protein